MKKATKIFYLLAALLCTALLVLTVSCGDKAGDGNVPGSGTGSGDINTGTQIEVPELPPSIGDDPFEGITYLTEGYEDTRYKVDSENKTLTSEYLDSDTNEWNTNGIVKYSYQESTVGTVVSFVYEKIYENGKWYTMQELYDQAEDLLKGYKKEDAKEYLEYLNGLTEEEKKAAIENQIRRDEEEYGVTLTEEDFASVDTYCEKIFATDSFKEDVQMESQYFKEMMEQIMTYLVQVGEPDTNGIAEISVEGQYITDLEWNKQTLGCFEAESNDDTEISSYVGRISLPEEGSFEIDSIDTVAKTMSGTYYDYTQQDENDYVESPLTVNYTQSGQNEDTVITVSIKEQTFVLTWSPYRFLFF